MNELSLVQLAKILLGGWKRIVMAGLGLAGVFVTVALTSNKVYEAEVVLFPKDSSRSAGLMSQLGQLGGIAGIMGLNLGGSSGLREESVAVLRSKAFVSEFITQNDLLPSLTAAKAGMFGSSSGKNMELQDAIKYFESHVRAIYDDKKLGIVRITIRWPDPNMAAKLANDMGAQLNRTVREQAIEESSSNVKYLRAELEKSQLVALSQSIGTLLEGELKRLMVARGSEQYAFRILDPAQPPIRPVWPRPVFMTGLGGLIGGTLAILSLLLPIVMRSTETRKVKHQLT